MNWLQKIYNAIRDWSAPGWLKTLILELQNLLVAIAKQVTKAYIDYLKAEIIYASQQNWSNEEKFNYVFKQAKKGFLEFTVTLKDSELHAIIEWLVLQLKQNKII